MHAHRAAASCSRIAPKPALATLLLAALCAFAVPLRGDTYPRQPGLRIAAYSFEVTLTDASNSIAMHETVAVDFQADGLTGMDLDLCNFRPAPRPATVNDIADPCAEPGAGGRRGGGPAPTGGKGMTVTAVTANGQPLQYQHQNDRLHIVFPQPSTTGGRLTITLDYHGVPANGLMIGNNTYGDREFFTNQWPDLARNWLAVIDHPSMKVPKTMTVIAPRHYQVISNGTLAESTDLPGDVRRTTWIEAEPICTWQMSLGAAPFAVDDFGVFQGIPMSAWVYPQERDASFAGFAKFTQPILEFYTQRIGPFSYEKLAQVEANTVHGGMELASDIFYGYSQDTIGATGGRQLMAHEMAHQWFGDSATENDWDDVWLSEGFATYFALLYQEHADGYTAMADALQATRSGVLADDLRNPQSTIVHQNLADISKVIANNEQIYQGGAWVLHMLRGLLGESTFWHGIQLYYSRYRNSNASTADFRRAMQDACNADGADCLLMNQLHSADLSWFFDEFLNRPGILAVKGTWYYDANAKQLNVTLNQIQSGPAYDMLIPLGVSLPVSGRGGRGGRAGRGPAPGAPPPIVLPPGATLPSAMHIEELHLTDTQQVFHIPLDQTPTAVALDPYTQVLMQFSLTEQR